MYLSLILTLHVSSESSVGLFLAVESETRMVLLVVISQERSRLAPTTSSTTWTMSREERSCMNIPALQGIWSAIAAALLAFGPRAERMVPSEGCLPWYP